MTRLYVVKSRDGKPLTVWGWRDDAVAACIRNQAGFVQIEGGPVVFRLDRMFRRPRGEKP